MDRLSSMGMRNARDLAPPHAVTDHTKLANLAASMARIGWQGEPILVVDGEVWTGSHRIAAAQLAGIDVPVYEWTPTDAQRAVLRYSANDQDSRLCDLQYLEDRCGEPCDAEALRIYTAECRSQYAP